MAKKKPTKSVAERIAERLFNCNGENAYRLAPMQRHPNYENGVEGNYSAIMGLWSQGDVVRIITEELRKSAKGRKG